MSGPGIPNYLDYPWRRRGLDHDRFLHRNLPQARPTVWPGKARVALWVAVHVAEFPMDMPRQPFVAPGGVDRPYPSYWDYTQRDYGNRVGIYRLMRVLDRRGLHATALM
ncbi:MAG: polysaccharide deacetylase, partial [Reyranellales bacterium]